MKRRSGAGGETNKGQRRKAPKPERRATSKAATGSTSSAAVREAEVARLTHELHEAVEHQTAASEVLDLIGSSPGELEQVFLAILKRATRICDAKFGFVHRYDGQIFHPAAQVGAPTELVEFHKRRGPFSPERGSMLDRIIRTKKASYTSDIAAATFPVAAAKIAGARVAALAGAGEVLVSSTVKDLVAGSGCASATAAANPSRVFPASGTSMPWNGSAEQSVARERPHAQKG